MRSTSLVESIQCQPAGRVGFLSLQRPDRSAKLKGRGDPMGKRFSGTKSGGSRTSIGVAVTLDYAETRDMRERLLHKRGAGIAPGHQPNGFPHFSSSKHHRCLCLNRCCLGPAGCICPDCPCTQSSTQTLEECFACGDPATQRVQGEWLCSPCKEEFESE